MRITIIALMSAITIGACGGRQAQATPDPTAQQAAAMRPPVATADPVVPETPRTNAASTTADANLSHELQRTSAAPSEPNGPSVTDDDALTTGRIRKALLDDKTLSFSAKNVEVSTANGKVTLRGVVPNEQERQVVEDSATKVVGAGRVDNQVQIRD